MSAPHPTSESVATPAEPRLSWGELSRRIQRRTSDCLAIALVLAACLGFGRQVREWWGTEPELWTNAAASGESPQVDWLGQGVVSVEWGEIPGGMTRQTVQGDRQTARQALRDYCLQRVTGVTQVTGSLEPAEIALLDQTLSLVPVLSKKGEWELFELDAAPVPFIIAVRYVHKNTGFVSSQVDQSPPTLRRVVCWGTALAASRERWTAWTFTRGQQRGVDPATPASPDQTAGGSKSTETATAAGPITPPDTGTVDTGTVDTGKVDTGKVAKSTPGPAAVSPGSWDIPLPPQARKILGLRDEQGSGVTAFSGTASPGAWAKFFDDWFQTQQAHSTGWQHLAGHWSNRYEIQFPTGRLLINVMWSADEHGSLTGLWSISRTHAATE